MTFLLVYMYCSIYIYIWCQQEYTIQEWEPQMLWIFLCAGCVPYNALLICESLWANQTAIIIYMYIYIILWLWYYISNSSSSELQRTSDHRHQTQAPVVEPDDDVARANREKDWADVPWPMTVKTGWLMVLCERRRWSKSAVYLIQSLFGVYLIYWCIFILI